jgi:hypothetical protein
MPNYKATAKLIDNVRTVVDDSRTHSVVCDLATASGGSDKGSTAVELAVMALADCVVTIFADVCKKSKIVQVQTPFGGGKTHALISLYHLLKNSSEVSDLENVKEILSSNRFNVPKVNVAVFVGTVPDPLKGKTPWGEIADQLGEYERLEKHDKKRITPGRDLLQSLLSDKKPTLILMDELTEYIVKAKEFEDQILAFCQELTEAVNASEQCMLVCTLPSSAPYGERGERVLSQLQRVFGRMQVIYTPVEGEEIYEILRKRLFESLGDPKVHEIVASTYFSLYKKLGEEIPPEAREIHYKEKLLKAYPFHPETIDTLFERWGSIPTFQRTRGALRLLAEVVSDLYNRQYPSTLIQPAQINLSNPRLRRMFIEHIGEVFESVIASDIGGENAKAIRIDRQMGTEYSRFNIATGLATSIFFYSFSGGEKKGTTAPRLRLAILREEIPPAIIGDAIKRLEDQLWFLHYENNLYYFSNVVGLNRVIIDKEEVVTENDIEAEFKSRLEKIAGTDFDVYIWPSSSSDIPDNKRVKLAILSCDFMAGAPKTERLIRTIINTYSTGFRTYKNSLFFLIADSNEYDGLKRTIRRFYALNTIKSEKETIKRLTEEDQERVEDRLKDADSSIPTRIFSLYRYLVKASRDGTKTYDLGIPTVGEKLSFTRRAKDYLKSQELLLERISPKVLVEKTFAKGDERKSVAEVREAFLKFPELSILESEQTFNNAVIQGVKDGTSGLLINDKLHYKETISTTDILDDAVIVTKEFAEKQKEKEGQVIEKEEEKEEETKVEKEITRKVSLRAEIPWDKLSDFVRGVVIPLSTEGAQITLEIKVEAQSEKGINRNTLDSKVKETLNQIGAKILEEKEE